MIVRVRYLTNLSNPTYRNVVEIETDFYPELQNLSEGNVYSYINVNAQNMSPTNGVYSSLKDEIMSQPIETPPLSPGKFYSVWH